MVFGTLQVVLLPQHVTQLHVYHACGRHLLHTLFGGPLQRVFKHRLCQIKMSLHHP